MNEYRQGRAARPISRVSRGVGAAVLSTVLIAGLAGCMTGRAEVGKAPVRNAEVPAGIDVNRPADRLAEQLDARDRAANPAPGMTADRIERLLQAK